MPVPADRFQKYLREMLAKFVKTPFAIPAAVAIATGVYALVAIFAPTGFCLSGLIAPLVLLGILWKFGIKAILKLLVIGAVACVVFSATQVAIYTQVFQHVSPVTLTSEDKITLTNGTLNPLFGSSETTYTYSVTLRINSTGTPIGYVNLVTASVGYPSVITLNTSMQELPGSRENKTEGTSTYTLIHYAYSVTTKHPVNQFWFEALVGNNTYLGAEYTASTVSPAVGPIFKDSFAVAGAFVLLSFINVFTGYFPVYALILLMVWWTRRARRMREEQYKKWEEERTKEEAKMPGEKGKVESKINLRQAMGMDSGGGFVCSECGADVPADATVCPKCGEKFE